MNIKHKLLLTIGLITAGRLAVAITPQAMNKIKAAEANLDKKYAIIKELNTAAKKDNAERIKFEKDGYKLSIESIEKLRKEIGEAIDTIKALDATYAKTKEEKRDEQFDIINNWVEQGKIGTAETIKLGNSTKEFVGISELQGPIDRIIDSFKTLFTNDLNYDSEVKLLSSALNRYNKQFTNYESTINAQYPEIGFATDKIFLGKQKDTNAFLFSDLKKQALKVAEKLENAKDASGTLLITQTSKWYEKKTVGEFIKEQVKTLKEDNLNKMDKAIAKIAKECAITHEFSGGDSPWVYADKKFFTPFLIKIKEETNKDFTDSDGGSFAYIQKETAEGTKSLTDMLLINDAAKVITDYVKIEPIQILNSNDYKKALQDFAVKYAQITVKALYYTTRLAAGDNAKNTDSNKTFYNNTLLKNVNELKKEFLAFYNTHKDKLGLDSVAIKFEDAIPTLKDLGSIKDTVEKINSADPTQI